MVPALSGCAGKRRLKDVKVDPLRPTEAALTWRMIPDKPRRDE